MPRASKPDNPSIQLLIRRSVSIRLDRLLGVAIVTDADVEVDMAAGMSGDPTMAFSPVSISIVAILKLVWSAGVFLPVIGLLANRHQRISVTADIRSR